jgi:hypothetical protein
LRVRLFRYRPAGETWQHGWYQPVWQPDPKAFLESRVGPTQVESDAVYGSWSGALVTQNSVQWLPTWCDGVISPRPTGGVEKTRTTLDQDLRPE